MMMSGDADTGKDAGDGNQVMMLMLLTILRGWADDDDHDSSYSAV